MKVLKMFCYKILMTLWIYIYIYIYTICYVCDQWMFNIGDRACISSDSVDTESTILLIVSFFPMRISWARNWMSLNKVDSVSTLSNWLRKEKFRKPGWHVSLGVESWQNTKELKLKTILLCKTIWKCQIAEILQNCSLILEMCLLVLPHRIIVAVHRIGLYGLEHDNGIQRFRSLDLTWS